MVAVAVMVMMELAIYSISFLLTRPPGSSDCLKHCLKGSLSCSLPDS